MTFKYNIMFRFPVQEAVAALLTAVALAIAYFSKVACFGPEFDSAGISGPGLQARWLSGQCYTDIQALWGTRDLSLHLFPYVHGGLTAGNVLPAGTVEYPVLTGVLIYLLALPAATDLQFFQMCAVFLAFSGILASVLLTRLSGWRSLWFVLAPSLILYSFLNWDLAVVLVTIGALGSAYLGLRDGASVPWLVACVVLLGAGGALKFYPLMFALPVSLGLFFTKSISSSRVRLKRALFFSAGVGAVFIIMNFPFILLDVHGWFAAYKFQWSRPIDASTNSIWYWAFRPFSSADPSTQDIMGKASTISTALGLLLALTLGFARMRRTGEYPWLQVCAIMLCAYLLLNKVHSPQYALWLLPFFVLLRIRSGWIIAYLVADFLTGVGWYLALQYGMDVNQGVPGQMLIVGVWGRAGLLVGLVGAFHSSEPAWRPRRKVPGAGSPEIGVVRDAKDTALSASN